MRHLSRYALSALALAVAAGLVASLSLGPATARGIWIAALIALPVQLALFSLLVWWRHRPLAVTAIWAGSVLSRMAVVAAAAFLLFEYVAESALAALLALAGFLFVLALLEGPCLRKARLEELRIP